MALTPNFSSVESLASPNLVTFTDTSSGSDGAISSRTITITLANGNYLTTAGQSSTPASEVWPYADSTITLDLLTGSTVGNVVVKWLNVGGAVLYSKTILTEWNLYDYLFAFELVQSQTATPNIILDTNYYASFFKFITNIFSGEAALTVGNDIYSCDAAIQKNAFIIANENIYF